MSTGARFPPVILTISLTVMLLIESTDYNYNEHFAFGKVSQPQSWSGPVLSDPNLKAEVILRGIDFPTSMSFLGDNDILVLEKNEGTVRRIVNGVMMENPLLKVNVSSDGERGMLGIAIAENARDISSNMTQNIFLFLTEEKTQEGSGVSNKSESVRNRVYRYDFTGDKLINPRLILDFSAEPRVVHNGGALVWGPDDYLYVVVGERSGTNPQENEIPDGRAGILRVDQEGDGVKNRDDEYLLGSTHPLNKYFAYGIRNSFGMDFDPLTAKLWDTENGPRFGDEINLVEPGFNSGWSKVQGIWDPRLQDNVISNTEGILDFGGRSNYSHPELTSVPSMGLTALSFLDSVRYGSHYQNDLFVGDFHNGFLYHFELNKERTELILTGTLEDKIANSTGELEQNIFGRGFGGITDIEVGPDGFLYILSLYRGGDNCSDYLSSRMYCISYNSEIQGTLFRIVPRME